MGRMGMRCMANLIKAKLPNGVVWPFLFLKGGNEMKTNFKGIVGIFVFVIITTSQISAQDVIQGCINVKNGNLRIGKI